MSPPTAEKPRLIGFFRRVLFSFLFLPFLYGFFFYPPVPSITHKLHPPFRTQPLPTCHELRPLPSVPPLLCSSSVHPLVPVLPGCFSFSFDVFCLFVPKPLPLAPPPWPLPPSPQYGRFYSKMALSIHPSSGTRWINLVGGSFVYLCV